MNNVRTKPAPQKNSENTLFDPVKLHEADFKLLRLIRSIGSGTIENINVQDGLPVSYKTAWKTGELV